MKQFFLFSILVLGLIACQSDSKPTEKSEPQKQVEPKAEPTNDEVLIKEASRLRAGGSIKSAKLENGKAIIEYVKNYSEHKELNPQSRVSEKDLELYWSTGKAIKKALNDGSVRLMRKLDFVEETEIILPYKGKTYTINVSKNDLEKYLGKSFEDVKKDWAKNFSDEYVYSDTGREKFFKKFGKIE